MLAEAASDAAQAPVGAEQRAFAVEVAEPAQAASRRAFSFDLRRFHRVTRRAPLMTSPHARGTLRYFDLLRLPDATFLYYEMARPDASHDLRTVACRAEPLQFAAVAIFLDNCIFLLT